MTKKLLNLLVFSKNLRSLPIGVTTRIIKAIFNVKLFASRNFHEIYMNPPPTTLALNNSIIIYYEKSFTPMRKKLAQMITKTSPTLYKIKHSQPKFQKRNKNIFKICFTLSSVSFCVRSSSRIIVCVVVKWSRDWEKFVAAET